MYSDLLKLWLATGHEADFSERAKILGFEPNPDYRPPVSPSKPLTRDPTPDPGTNQGPEKPEFHFPIVRVLSAEPLETPDPSGQLSGIQPIEIEDDLPQEKPLRLKALSTDRQLCQQLEQVVLQWHMGRRLDTRRLVRRSARQKPLSPLPYRQQRLGRGFALALFDYAPAWRADHLALCRQLQRLAADIRPASIARIFGPENDWLLDYEGERITLSKRDIPAHALVLLVGDAKRPSVMLKEQLRRLKIRPQQCVWLGPQKGRQQLLWDQHPTRVKEDKALRILLGLLWPLPVVSKPLLRELRRQLGASMSVEQAFWQHIDVRYQENKGVGRVTQNTLRHQRTLQWHYAQSSVVIEPCLEIVVDYLKTQARFLQAEAWVALSGTLSKAWAWVAKQQATIGHAHDYLARLGATVQQGEEDLANSVASCLLQMANRQHALGYRHWGAPMRSALVAAQQHWQTYTQEHIGAEAALLGEFPHAGLSGDVATAQLVFRDGELSVQTEATQGVSVASLHLVGSQAVLEQQAQRSLLGVNQPIAAQRFRLYDAHQVFEVEQLHSKDLYWARSVEQRADGLWAETSQELQVFWPSTGDGPLFDLAYAPEWLNRERLGVDKHGLYADLNYQNITQRLRWIPPGDFLMGSPKEEPERRDNETQHPVTLTQGFWLADTACTQALWQAVMGDNPSDFKGDELPVENVSWHDVQQFCHKLSGEIPGLQLHLPSEAQWEYACRAGTQTPFCWGDTLGTEHANYRGTHPYNNGSEGEYRERTVPVKSFEANPWGLYQLHGNVWEWCQDWFEKEYPQEQGVDPMKIDKGDFRMLRGGSWLNGGYYLRAAYRDHWIPDGCSGVVGFRFADCRGPAKPRGGAPTKKITAGGGQ